MIHILVADDHKIYRKGLRAFCNEEPELAWVGEAGNGQEAVKLAEELNPDVILMDIRMPVMDGIQATSLIVEKNPEAKVIILTTYRTDDNVFEAIKAGAKGYILKEEDRILETIKNICGGGIGVDPFLAKRALNEFKRTEKDDKAEKLTEREMEILKRIAESGDDDITVAARLGISPRTISNHLSSIYRKLSVNTRLQAALFALREGWASLDPQ